MFAMGSATRMYVANGATGMRKGFCGLEGLTRERLDCILPRVTFSFFPIRASTD